MIMLSVAFAYLIHWNGDGLALQWAFLIVFGVYLLLAALLGFIGVRKVKQVRGPGAGDPPGAGDRGRAQALLTGRAPRQPRRSLQRAVAGVDTVAVGRRPPRRRCLATWSAVRA